MKIISKFSQTKEDVLNSATRNMPGKLWVKWSQSRAGYEIRIGRSYTHFESFESEEEAEKFILSFGELVKNRFSF